MKKAYEKIENYFNGIKCTFRRNIISGSIEIKVDKNFAKCNGYDSVDAWVNATPELKQAIDQNFDGKVPEWLLVTKSGELIAVNQSKLN